MEKTKKRIRICLLFVVMLAVVMGILYYYHQLGEEGMKAEGTLVSVMKEEWSKVCRK